MGRRRDGSGRSALRPRSGAAALRGPLPPRPRVTTDPARRTRAGAARGNPIEDCSCCRRFSCIIDGIVAIYDRLLTKPDQQSFFLLGLRGVGKSLWVRTALAAGPVRLDLLDERLYQDLLADPSLFAASLGELRPGDWAVVDEVQRLPALPERGPSAHRGAPAPLRPARVQRAQAEGGRGEPAGRAGAASHHVPADRLGTRRGLRSRPGAPPRVAAARLDRREAAGGPRSLGDALPAGGDPRRGAGPQPVRVRPLPSRRPP